MSRAGRIVSPPRRAQRGFTLIELMITLIVLGITVGGLMVVLQQNVGTTTATKQNMEAKQKAQAALEWIAQDLRGAGSGIDFAYTTPQTSIAYVDSVELMLCGDFTGAFSNPVDTLAYQPTGNPKPFKLTGSYAPPIKYRTGAELIRWTLDLDNNGAIGAADVTHAEGIDALRSRNPNDYTLIRQVYGDSLSLAAGNNVGAVSRISLVRAPGAGVPNLFTVIMNDGTTWNWGSGPVPANRLKDISHITVQITSESSVRNKKGQYARVTLSSTVNVYRVGA